MARNKKQLRSIKIQPETEKDQFSLKLLNVLKSQSSVSITEISRKCERSEDEVADYINRGVKKDILEISGSGKGELVKFNGEQNMILGIGFNKEECILTVINLDGKVVTKEQIQIDVLSGLKGKNKEIKEIASQITEKTGIKGGEFCCCGIAIPKEIEIKNNKSSQILGEGISRFFNCDVFISKEATAAGYGERNSGVKVTSNDILYMHSDIGAGVLFKDEMIFEADDNKVDGIESYLRPWSQFSIVATAKNLVSKGVGTDIVNKVGGNIDDITLDVVLEAAEGKDELAEDLVKRAGLALGVRVAYLANMFNTSIVSIGGGVEKKEGSFKDFIEESARRFLVKEIAGKIKIIPGVLGKEAPPIGAALLCLRELFMEV